jgi:hypothetical protein
VETILEDEGGVEEYEEADVGDNHSPRCYEY